MADDTGSSVAMAALIPCRPWMADDTGSSAAMAALIPDSTGMCVDPGSSVFKLELMDSLLSGNNDETTTDF